jgi:glycosyltransferase involved in cell wall biosynthesis
MTLQRPTAILLSAFAAHPEMSSETGIGWQFIRATIAATHESKIHVVAVMNQRSAVVVEFELQRLKLAHRVTVVGIDMPVGFKWMLKPQLTRLEYLVWNFISQQKIREMESQFDFILAHHVTFATEMFPTPITACGPSTFKVWGPIGSAGDPNVYRVPPVDGTTRREELVQRLRDIIVKVPMSLVGRKVDHVLAQNGRVSEEFGKRNISVEVFPNVIIKSDLQNEIDKVPERSIPEDWDNPERPLRILAVGHLVARKRFELGMLALTSEILRNSSFHLIGTPLPGHRDLLPGIAEQLGVSDRVNFMGRRQRSEVLSCMADFDVLFHPSGREGASGVVGEATAMGIPVVCFDNTGASSVLDDAMVAGVRLKATLDTSADDIALAIRRGAKMKRVRSTVWNERRFEGLQRRLVQEAWHRRLERGGVQ